MRDFMALILPPRCITIQEERPGGGTQVVTIVTLAKMLTGLIGGTLQKGTVLSNWSAAEDWRQMGRPIEHRARTCYSNG